VTLDVDLDEPCPAEHEGIERSGSLDCLDRNPPSGLAESMVAIPVIVGSRGIRRLTLPTASEAATWSKRLSKARRSHSAARGWGSSAITEREWRRINRSTSRDSRRRRWTFGADRRVSERGGVRARHSFSCEARSNASEDEAERARGTSTRRGCDLTKSALRACRPSSAASARRAGPGSRAAVPASMNSSCESYTRGPPRSFVARAAASSPVRSWQCQGTPWRSAAQVTAALAATVDHSRSPTTYRASHRTRWRLCGAPTHHRAGWQRGCRRHLWFRRDAVHLSEMIPVTIGWPSRRRSATLRSPHNSVETKGDHASYCHGLSECALVRQT